MNRPRVIRFSTRSSGKRQIVSQVLTRLATPRTEKELPGAIRFLELLFSSTELLREGKLRDPFDKCIVLERVMSGTIADSATYLVDLNASRGPQMHLTLQMLVGDVYIVIDAHAETITLRTPSIGAASAVAIYGAVLEQQKFDVRSALVRENLACLEQATQELKHIAVATLQSERRPKAVKGRPTPKPHRVSRGRDTLAGKRISIERKRRPVAPLP